MTGISHVEEHRGHESPFVAVFQCADQTDSGGRQKTRGQDGQHHHHCRCLCDMLTVDCQKRNNSHQAATPDIRPGGECRNVTSERARTSPDRP